MKQIRVDLAQGVFAHKQFLERGWGPPECDVKLDLPFVAGDEKVQAILLARPVMLVHRFEIQRDLVPFHRLALARSLMAYGQGYVKDRQFDVAGCLFQVASGNATMEEFARTLGGKPQDGSTLYRIDYA